MGIIIVFIMIRTFKDRETEKVFRREYSKKLPTDIQKTALRKTKNAKQID